jgi:putative ABC transport system permease protein
MQELLQDIRYAIRTLIKSPGFAAVAVLSLALGIGANTTIFSLINTLFFRPLPVERPEELVSIYTTDEKNPGPLPISHPNAQEIADNNNVFSGVLHATFAQVALASGGEPQQTNAVLVSGNYFDVLGVKAALGRTFLPEEDKTLGTHPVVVLGYGLWQQRFAGDPAIVGKEILINSRGFTVIGVMPEYFRGTNVLGGGPPMYLPMMMYKQVLTGSFLDFFDQRRPLICPVVIGRMKPGVTIEQATANVQAIAKQMEQEFPVDNKGRGATLLPMAQSTLQPGFRDQVVIVGALLMIIVGVVLLIACANVANLLLARATRRRREIAVRLSLGASRGRLVRQLLTESVILAVLGGLVGLLVAFWARDVIVTQFLPQQGRVPLPLDSRVLLFTGGICLLTGILFGLFPALQSTRPDVLDAIKDQTGSISGGRRRLPLRNVLVVLQVALSLTALVLAGLFLKSLWNMQQLDPGFETKRLLHLSFDIGAQGYDQARAEDFYKRLVERVRALPGVEAAALASFPPLGAGFARTVFPEGVDDSDRSKGVLTLVNNVGPSYVEAMGLTLVKGRSFQESDNSSAPPVVVVNEAMAERHWPGQDVLGKRFKFFGDKAPVEIVGVVKNSKYNALGEAPQANVYIALAQRYEAQVTLHVRTQGDPDPMVNVVRREVQAMEPTMPLTGVETIKQTLHDSLQAPRSISLLLGIFGALALGMACLGIYGVTSYSVSQRTREIGIRMALGARSVDVLGLVLRQGMTLVVVGLGIGMVGAYLLRRQADTLLVGVGTIDPFAFGVTAAALAGIAALAIYVPARRATRVNPVVALKYE